MKKSALLIQFRENELVARHEKKCLSRYLGGKVDLITVNLFSEDLDSSNKFSSGISAVILGGSSFSFSEREKYPSLWNRIKKITPFLKKLIKEDIFILGICFGHQYIAYILGAEIIRDKSQQEVGTPRAFLTKKGRVDPLFHGMPLEFFVQEAHKDSIKKLPPGTTLLVKGGKCRIQAFRYKNAYGVQFHPELGIKDMRFRASFYSDYVAGKRVNLKPTPFGKKVLKNFLKLYIGK